MVPSMLTARPYPIYSLRADRHRERCRSRAIYPGLPPARRRCGHHARSPCPVHCRAMPPCQGPSLSVAWPRPHTAVVPAQRCHRGCVARAERTTRAASAGAQRGRDPPVGKAQCGSEPHTTAAGHTQHYASGLHAEAGLWPLFYFSIF
jgi:hypothetical protein